MLRCQESCEWKQRHRHRRRCPRSALEPPFPSTLFPSAAGRQPGPCRGGEAGVQLRPSLPPRDREGAAGRGRRRACSAGGGCQAAGARPGGQTGSDHGHGVVPSRATGGAGRWRWALPSPAQRRLGAAGGGCAHHGPHHRRGPPASAPAQWRRRSPSVELSSPPGCCRPAAAMGRDPATLPAPLSSPR